MNKRKHMFFLYCIVFERNRYTEWCYANGLKPKLPQAKSDKLMVAPSDQIPYDNYVFNVTNDLNDKYLFSNDIFY